jgi:chromosome segregation ATPase
LFSCDLFVVCCKAESPFRLMDEYDVFMDEARRNETLQSLISYTRLPDQRNRQMIVITPLSLKSVTVTDDVRVYELQEPDKGSAHGLQQATIDF